MFFNAIVAAASFAAFSSAHVVITTPIPFSVPALHNGPLAADGSDFPCQSTSGTYSAGAGVNVFALGSTQPLEFMGTAVHGGGSCQVSITYDTAPNKNSVWKVIHSIEGGCPAKNTPGNLGNDPNFKVPFDYSFPIPTDIPAGNATIAWTWLNKIGNREYYMNCAPVSLTGKGGDKSNWEALPDLLVANVGNGCTTVEGEDYKYPNPGNSVEIFATGPLSFPVGNCGPVAQPAAGGSGSGSGSGSGAGSGAAPSAAPPAPAPSAQAPGGVFITVTTPAAAPTAAPPAAPPVVAPVPAAPAAPAAAPSSGGGYAPGTPCSPEGQWYCIAGTSFQRCASGSWSALMAVSAGTTCQSGSSSTLQVSATSSKKRRAALRAALRFRR